MTPLTLNLIRHIGGLTLLVYSAAACSPGAAGSGGGAAAEASGLYRHRSAITLGEIVELPSDSAEVMSPSELERTRINSFSGAFARFQTEMIPGDYQKFVIPLARGRAVEANLTLVEIRRGVDGTMRQFWRGVVPDDPTSLAVFVADEAGYEGTLHVGDNVYRFVDQGEFRHDILPSTQTALPSEGDGLMPSPVSVTPPFTDKTECANAVVDVLVLYTAEVLKSIGSKEKLARMIDEAEFQANTALEQSGVRNAIRVVGFELTDYVSRNSAKQDLDSIRVDNGIKLRRQAHRADVVSLWIDTDQQSCGEGYVISQPWNWKDWGFHVVIDHCSTSARYSFAHELGHNLGMAHDKQHTKPGTGGADPSFSYGHRLSDNRRVTLESVDCPPGTGTCAITRILRYSASDKPIGGMATGIAPGLVGAADNARTARWTMCKIAAWY